ncbi:hypothetical protein AGDE_13405 [Angomonas deanei]|uniref:Uncharacterized protein n=1 Tax=Angomonas deanei TaxID=59799 RepID=A0A7G2C620_9TRYP|nr:hypothetical protein AGDE_13405 [Angomonas deanei]CAD2214591.1 hypothetical protein, conserved [Angomonas deanei]|eukprot:EPY22439.1 hypothetical protein AGDE_13405 [Angomonas deanei]
MFSQEVLRIIFLNEKAALWAIVYGPLLALLYLYVLSPRLTRCSHCANLKKFVQYVSQRVEHLRQERQTAVPQTPTRLSTASSHFRTPPSPGSTERKRRTVSPPRRSVSFLETREMDDSEEDTSLPINSPNRLHNKGDDFTVIGQSMKLASPQKGLPLPQELQKKEGKPAWWKRSKKEKENAFLTDALDEGHIVFIPHVVNQSKTVMAYNNHFERILHQYKRRQLYKRQSHEETRRQLDALFATESFQDWFEQNRDEIYKEIDIRQREMTLRRVTTLLVLWLLCAAIPFFSFTAEGATWTGVTALLDPAAYPQNTNWKSATLVDHISRALLHVQQHATTVYKELEKKDAPVATTAHHTAALLCYQGRELLLLAATVSLFVFAFMPRQESFTAATALAALLYLLLEITLTNHEVTLQLGAGFIGVMVMIMISMVKSMQRNRRSDF